MEDKDLIQRLTLLQEVKPREHWVLFARAQILAHEQRRNLVGHVLSYLRYLEKPFDFAQGKPAYVFAALALIVLGGVGWQLSQNSLPGDALYSVRSVIEKATTSSGPLSSLQVAQRRLEDLKKVVEGNKVKNLPQATQEFNLSVAEVSKGILELVEKEPDKALQASLELVQLQKGRVEIEQILGAEIGGKEAAELQSATKILVEAEINDLIDRALTDEQKGMLTEALLAYQAGDYGAALEYLWSISNAPTD